VLFGSAERELVCAYVQQRVYAGGLEIVLQIKSHRHGRVQSRSMQADGADERRLGHVRVEPREWELMHALLQQRVHRIRELLVFGRSAFRCISQPPHPAYPPGPAVPRISCTCAIKAGMEKCCNRYGRGSRSRVPKHVSGCGQARGTDVGVRERTRQPSHATTDSAYT
jgi:hypothetical protein